MKTNKRIFGRLIMMGIMLTSLCGLSMAQNAQQGNISVSLPGDGSVEYAVYKGSVIDDNTKKPLVFANIGLLGTNIATVSNTDGEFVLKVAKDVKAEILVVTHIGYDTYEIKLSDLKPEKNVLQIHQATIQLSAIDIYPTDAKHIILQMKRNIKDNYPLEPNMMKGFYRETIKKNKSYVGISEAVVDVYKAGYKQSKTDQLSIYKGRKSQDVAKMDTILFKLQGGPSTSLMFDVIKNPLSLLSESYLEEYIYSLTGFTRIDGKPHYVVEFIQNEKAEYPLYSGTFYIESSTFALTSAEFRLNLEDPEAAAEMLIKKKPIDLTVTPKEVSYRVNFVEHDGKWYFSYARGEMALKLNWKKKLFNSTYATMIEIAITDRMENGAEPFKFSERFKDNQVMAEEVGTFVDIDFWGAHNTIEPDESIQTAIKKLERKGRF